MINIRSFKKNIYSQNGEDGIIEYVLDRLPKNRWCCEFGAWDGKYLSNTFNLVSNHGYKAVYIEADQAKYQHLLVTGSEHADKIIALNRVVGFDENSLDIILSETTIPIDFDILSIDVDGIDFALWQSLNNYRPKIVIIEINSSLDPCPIYNVDDLTVKRLSDRPGVNFGSCLELGKSKGYTLLTHIGNMIFIENEYRTMFKDTDIIKDDYLKFDKGWL